MGFGVDDDVKTTDHVAVRVLQLDWLPTRVEGVWAKGIARFGFGIVLK